VELQVSVYVILACNETGSWGVNLKYLKWAYFHEEVNLGILLENIFIV
jgi:hypothetical protein